MRAGMGSGRTKNPGRLALASRLYDVRKVTPNQ
jgi:hypothetical protein